MIVGFFIFVVVIITIFITAATINDINEKSANLKAMEMGYQQVVEDGYKVWRKVDVENNLVP